MTREDVVLPRLGETMEDAEIVEWHRAPGEEVRRGDVLLDVQTDKIVAEVPALRGGVLAEILAPPGTVVKVGEVIARLHVESAGETSPHEDAPPPSQEPTPNEVILPAPTATRPTSDRPAASPSARRLARELGVDLARVT
ncbi:biotin/lipoyl-containing protein, partial [Deinococcus pimensis]|uniref:biotin/lipoyl-containing protein n=1 Tax=Deinococcus pimensis TaxID=309888 RepID=UPI0005EB953A